MTAYRLALSNTLPSRPLGKIKLSLLILLSISIVLSNGVRYVHAQPTVGVWLATDITDTSAKLQGFVNPNGQDTQWHFFVWTDEPGPHNNNNINCPSPDFGSLPGNNVVAPVSCVPQLDPSTTYSFVLVANWLSGESATSDSNQFTTLSGISTASLMSFQTDWALSNPTMSPAHPKVGDRVAFAVTLTALSSTAGYPQTVILTFALDGTHIFFDTSQYDYPGPTGNPIRLEAGVDPREVWFATSGSHMVEWTVEPVNVGPIVTATDPNTANNHVSLPFSVGPAAPAFDFTLSVSPASVSVKQGDTAHYMAQVTYSDPSYSGTVINIQATGLGQGMGWDLSENGDLSISTNSITPPRTYTITLTGSAKGVSHPASATLVVTASQPATTTAQTTTSPATSVSSATVTQTPIPPTTVTVTQTSGPTTTSQTSTGQSSQGGGSFIDMIPGGVTALGAVAAIVILAAAAILFRRRGTRPPTEAPAPPSTTPGVAPPLAQPPSVKYCISCGAQIPRTAKFCPECRANQTQ